MAIRHHTHGPLVCYPLGKRALEANTNMGVLHNAIIVEVAYHPNARELTSPRCHRGS